MDELDDPGDSCVKACLFAELPVSENSIADIFFVIRERPDNTWYIHGMLAWVQIPTIRSENGFMDVHSTYLLPQGPLPTADQIARDLQSLVSLEESVDFFYIKNDLENQLARIGFYNSVELLRSARHSEGFTYLESSQPIADGGPYGDESVHFEFIIVVDKSAGTARLSIIKAFLESHSPNAAAIKEQTEAAFYPLNNQFHHKDAMIQEVRARMTPDISLDKALVMYLFKTNRIMR
ncbi:hypothetical protein [Puia dinghuensis]|uniref:Uncharacterized protein n=1 Tax=Puia dinghuensis TaxID=1792502 RepID=A0A8J2XWV8_9BACT|nr:hypothetical protein [Puia dinghuensis]GGB26132.1 hypothetical protein GCM10011511_57630 [Puia dinghuensis]